MAVGSNSGLEHEEALNFGTRDAAEFAALMVELGGATPSNVHVLLNPTKAAFESKLEAVVRLLARDSTLIFYYSGHGNETHLHFAGQAIDRGWLKRKLDSSGARLRLMFVDACRGVKERGFELSRAFEVGRLEYRGLVIIQSASRGEVAFESRRLQGGLFTRHLLSGLRGPADTDRDGRVSLDEAYTFAHGHTLSDSGATQVPDREVLITGSGALELTTVVRTESRLLLPIEPAARYTFFRKDVRAVFAEAWSSSEDRMQIALPIDTFVVWRRAGETSGIAEIETQRHGTHYVTESDFAKVQHDEVQERGGTVGSGRPHRFGVALGLVVAPRMNGEHGVGETAAVDYAWVPREDHWAPTVGFALHRESFDAASNNVDRDSYQIWTGVLTPAGSLGPVTVNGSIGIGAMLTQQHKTTDASAATESLGFQRLGAVLQMCARVPVSGSLAWAMGLAANPTIFRETRRRSAGEVTDSAESSSTHVAASTAFSLTTGLVLRL